MKKKITEEEREVIAIRELLRKAKKEMNTFNYKIEVRGGKVFRTIISEVYNGTDFQE